MLRQRWPMSPAATTPANTGSHHLPCICCRPVTSHKAQEQKPGTDLCFFAAKFPVAQVFPASSFHHSHENNHPFRLRVYLSALQRSGTTTRLLSTEGPGRGTIRAGLLCAGQRALF